MPIERFFVEYVRALDDRRFAQWLELFADDAFYGVIRHEDHARNNDMYVVGESMEKLRVRVQMGAELDRQMQVHLVSAARLEDEAQAGTIKAQAGTMKASANFVVLRDNYVAYAGQYRVELVSHDGAALKIKRCVAVVTNERPEQLLYLPI